MVERVVANRALVVPVSSLAVSTGILIGWFPLAARDNETIALAVQTCPRSSA